VARCLALLAYEGDVAADLVAGIKYRNRRSALPGLGRALAAQARAAGGEVAAAVTWIPTTPGRRRRRGFDHGQLLAGHVAGALGVPLVRLLARAEGRAQTGSTRRQRLEGPRLRPLRPASGLVLAVDDVVTTGATAAAAAAALTSAGAREVWVLAAARRSAQGEGAAGRRSGVQPTPHPPRGLPAPDRSGAPAVPAGAVPGELVAAMRVRLAALPCTRPGVVASARARLAAEGAPSAERLARLLVDHVWPAPRPERAACRGPRQGRRYA
jgi:predicted amidophosphoribosyltransferase